MTTVGTRWFLPLALAMGGTVVAAALLGYYSYRASERIASESEASLERSNRLLGLKLVDRIERVIIDSDRAMFRLVRLDDPVEFRELWRRIVRISPMVQSVVVLDQRQQVVQLVSKLVQADQDRFRATFQQQIVPAMELPDLPAEAHRHLHKTFEGTLYLISYIKERSLGRDYTIALSVNLRYITREIFKEEFRELGETKYLAITDDDGQTIYGTPPPEGYGPVFTARFPTTLYRWRLQLAPREAGRLRREVRARRTTNLVLVALADGLILLGMITLLVAARKERRANELKSDFISNVTHELKTPLSLIRMFGELIALGRGGSSGHKAREYAEIIIRESDRLARLIDNVLDFARIERGKAGYTFAPAALEPLLERAVDLSRYRAEQAGVTLEIHLDAEPLPELMLDENATMLLLLNLLENALKYGVGEAEPRIVVSAGVEQGAVVVRVADNGPGIPAEELSRVFERFFRGKRARSRSTRGSGIGLSLVKHIAAAHRGRVTVESEAGGGTTFTVTFPLNRGAAGEK